MDIPGVVVKMYRSRVTVDGALSACPEYGKRNIRRWYRWMAEGRGLQMPDYRTVARACRMVVIDTPEINRSGEPVRDEALGEYALPGGVERYGG